MKKILFNLILFILVASGTSVCVICAGTNNFSAPQSETISLNQASISNTQNETEETIEPEDEAEDEEDPVSTTLFGIINNFISKENYNAKISISSSNSKLSGELVYSNSKPVNDIKEIDISALSVSLAIEGKIKTNTIETSIVLNDGMLFVHANCVNVKVAVSSIPEMVNQISSCFGISTSTNSFDISTILVGATCEKISGGSILSLSIPKLGEINITANNDFEVQMISANNIDILSSSFSLNITKSEEALNAASVFVEDYVDISKLPFLLSSIIEVSKSLPISYYGTMNFNGISANINASIDQSLNTKTVISYNNTNIYIYTDKESVTLKVFDLVVHTTFSEFVDFVTNFLGFCPTNNFGITEILENSINFSDNCSIALSKSNNTISRIVASIDNFSLDIKKGYFVTAANNCDLSKAISLNRLKSIILTYDSALSKLNEFNFNIYATINNSMIFSGNGYLKTTNSQLSKFYISGKSGDMNLEAYANRDMVYLNALGTKVCASKSNLDSVTEMIKNYVGIDGVLFSDIVNIVTKNIYNISYNEGGFEVKLSSGGTIKVLANTSTIQLKLIGFAIKNNIINATITSTKNNYAPKYEELDSSSYSDISSLLPSSKAFVNTFIDGFTASGNATIKMLGIELYNITISLRSSYSNGKIGLCGTIGNLPTIALITSVNSIKYVSQSTSFSLQNGVLSYSRKALNRFSGKNEVLSSNSVELTNVTPEIISDMFGFDGTITSKIKDAVLPTNLADLLILDSIEVTDSSLAASLKTSSLLDNLKDTCLSISISNDKISAMTASFGFTNFIDITIDLEVK